MGNASSKAPHDRQTHKHRHQRTHKHRRSHKYRGGTTPLSKLNPAYHLNTSPSPKPKLYRNTSREESLLVELLNESVPPMFRNLKNKKKAIAEKKAVQKSKSAHSKK
jgi:hypothetical protein